MSDKFGLGQVLSTMSFVGYLGEEMSSPDGSFDKGVETYIFSTILEITVAGFEGKAKRLMVSRHSDPIFWGPKVSK